MKNQKNKKNEENPKKICNKSKCWRILAITAIVIFAIFIIGGIIKAHYFKPDFIKPTKEQIDSATNIATEKLQSTGANISDFTTQIGKGIHRPRDDSAGNIIQVSFLSNVTTHTYIVDVSSGEIILHSQTDIYKQLGSPSKEGFFREFGSPFKRSNIGNGFGCSRDDIKCDGEDDK